MNCGTGWQQGRRQGIGGRESEKPKEDDLRYKKRLALAECVRYNPVVLSTEIVDQRALT